jgi:hypothetical protein
MQSGARRPQGWLAGSGASLWTFSNAGSGPASDAGPDGALKSALMIPDKAEDLRVMDEITIGCELAPAKSEGAAS